MEVNYGLESVFSTYFNMSINNLMNYDRIKCFIKGDEVAINITVDGIAYIISVAGNSKLRKMYDNNKLEDINDGDLFELIKYFKKRCNVVRINGNSRISCVEIMLEEYRVRFRI